MARGQKWICRIPRINLWDLRSPIGLALHEIFASPNLHPSRIQTVDQTRLTANSVGDGSQPVSSVHGVDWMQKWHFFVGNCRNCWQHMISHRSWYPWSYTYLISYIYTVHICSISFLGNDSIGFPYLASNQTRPGKFFTGNPTEKWNSLGTSTNWAYHFHKRSMTMTMDMHHLLNLAYFYTWLFITHNNMEMII